MNKPFLTLALLAGLGTARAQDAAAPFAATITPQDFRRHLEIIAADSLEGRDTGSPGERKAARYITGQFQKLGLKPVGTDGPYLQDIGLVRRSVSEAFVRVGKDPLEYGKQFFLAPGAYEFRQETTRDVVFAGYGIDDEKYSELKDLNLKNKLVFVLPLKEPKNADGTYAISGTTKPSVWSDPRLGPTRRAEALLAKGAQAVITLAGDTDEQAAALFERMKAGLSRASLSFRDEPNAARRLPNFMLNASAVKTLFNLDDAALAALRAGKPKPGSLTGKLGVKAVMDIQPLPASNIAGLLDGTDKKEEVVVISAHYDHIGVNPQGQVFNGANDNGSGTVLVMELAEAFAEAARQGQRPRRSLLFLIVTGEEKGLLGSQYYSEHPLLPLQNTVADLNTDMVGRSDKPHEGKPDFIYVIGADKLSSELHTINEEANKKVGLALDYTYNDPADPNRFYYRSDHYNFAKKGIPSIFYFNGTHPDYHGVGDDVEKINFESAVKSAKLVFYTAWELVNRPKRIVVDSNKP